MKKKNKSLEFVIVRSIVLLLLVFAILMVVVGYRRFTRYYTHEYNDSAYRTAKTAAALIKVDNIDLYLDSNGDNEEYKITNDRLNILTNKQDVSVIYVIKPDSDYKHFTSIFNSVSAGSGYTPWVIGSKKKTTNKEYEKYYKEIMERGRVRATVIRNRNLNGALPHITSLIPLTDSNGNVKAILCVQRFMKGLTRARFGYVFNVSILTFVIIIITIILALNFLKKQIIRPIEKVSREAKRFATLSNRSKNNLSNISNISEVTSLALSIDKMEKDTIKYIEDIKAATKEKERIGTELKLASLIQENSLPTDFPSNESFELYASMTPAKEVGGDFYDFNLIDDDHLMLVIADVSGKGVPAALFMMVTKILISEYSLSLKDPAQVLTTVNNRICNNNKANMFVTVWLGILELSTGKLVFANAGHEDFVLKNGDGFKLNKTKHGIPIGAMEDYEYKNNEVILNKGDKLFLYTDGLPEATNSELEMFNLDRMVDTLNELKDLNTKELLNEVKNKVDTFVGEATQFDDLTMMALIYKGDSAMKKKFNASMDELNNVLKFIDDGIKDIKDSKLLKKFNLVVEEIFVNIVSYAYPDSDTNNTVTISIKDNDDKTIITFIDSGKHFNPLIKDDPDLSLSVDERPIGGLGIYLVKKMMDNVEYEYKDNKNILTIEKRHE